MPLLGLDTCLNTGTIDSEAIGMPYLIRRTSSGFNVLIEPPFRNDAVDEGDTAKTETPVPPVSRGGDAPVLVRKEVCHV